MAKLAKQINDNKLEFSKNARKELTVLNNALREILTLTVEAFSKNDLTEAVKVEPLEQVIDDLTKEIRNYHIERLQKGKCDSRLGVFLTDYITNCERASDHCLSPEYPSLPMEFRPTPTAGLAFRLTTLYHEYGYVRGHPEHRRLS